MADVQLTPLNLQPQMITVKSANSTEVWIEFRENSRNSRTDITRCSRATRRRFLAYLATQPPQHPWLQRRAIMKTEPRLSGETSDIFDSRAIFSIFTTIRLTALRCLCSPSQTPRKVSETQQRHKLLRTKPKAAESTNQRSHISRGRLRLQGPCLGLAYRREGHLCARSSAS